MWTTCASKLTRHFFPGTIEEPRPRAWATCRNESRMCVKLLNVARRQLQTPGTAEEYRRQETPTINLNDLHPAQPTVKTHNTNQFLGVVGYCARKSHTCG